MTVFKSPRDSIGTLSARTAARLVAAAADLALVVDHSGIIRDLFVQDADLAASVGIDDDWIGRDWRAQLATASQARADELLADARAVRPARWRSLNHVGRNGADNPVLYTAVALREPGTLVLLGRDLRPISALQQRLLDAQQVIERDHVRLRHLELRHRLLLNAAPEPILVLNAANQKITEANPAMASLLGRSPAELTGQAVPDLFARSDHDRIAGSLAAIRAGGRAPPIHVRLADGSPGGDSGVMLSGLPFRDDQTLFVLLRITRPAKTPKRTEDAVSQGLPSLLQLMEQAPDGFVVTDAEGQIQRVNAAFLAMAELGQPGDAVGQPLDRWLGAGGIDMDILLTNLRQRGTVQLFGTSLAGASGLPTMVEVSAVTLQDSGGQVGAIGFAIRDVGRRVVDSRPGREMPRSVDQLTELIGRVPLKDLVREATDMIERLCIEAALEMTRDNRASAAELLGLSRQSLYVKLRRYGLGDLAELPG